ncbi:MAG: FAD:protein FMN transferase [Gemmatimonadota bacterium]|nr:FAD:protein FMN transferase [Gemmatimonadota bacterium]
MRALTRAAVGVVVVALMMARPVAAGPERVEVSVSRILMGTLVEATVLAEDESHARAALLEAFLEMERVEALLHTEGDGSDIAALNESAGGEAVPVGPEAFGVIARAWEYRARSGGLFDVSVGALTALWGFGDHDARVPEAAEVAALLPGVGAGAVVMDAAAGTVRLPSAVTRVDLGAIAKGYAVDRAAAVLRERGLRDFLLNAGGDVFASGRKRPGRRWWIGIRHPRRAGELLGHFELEDAAVATSGDYERFVEVDGVRHHHILDPRSGWPARGSRSATAIAPTAEEADARATWLFIAGGDGNGGEDGEDRGVVPFPRSLHVDATGRVRADSLLIVEHGLVILD